MSNKLLTPKFLTSKMAATAVQHVFNNTLLSEDMASLMNRKQGHIVILVPAMLDERVANYPNWPNYTVRPHLLYEQSEGTKESWEYPFADIARCKALQLWQNRNDDGQTDSNAHLLFPGDTPYWGGVKRHGMVVAFSGERPWIDQLISGNTADMLKALGRDAFERSSDKTEGLSFLS